MKKQKLKILPPWSIYINKLIALFDPDKEIAFNVEWSGENPNVTLATNNPNKAAALAQLLPTEKQFGNITLTIGIDCFTTSNLAFPTAKELFETAFKDNPVFAYCIAPAQDGYVYFNFIYVCFIKEITQIFSDNIQSPWGVSTYLYQDIAKEVFEDMPYLNKAGICYCTVVEDEVNSEAMLLAETATGTWNVDIKLSQMPQKIATAFDKLNDMFGTHYEYIAYLGTQVVNGVNHAVLAKQEILTGKDTDNIVLVIFNEKPEDMNDPVIVNIERIIEGSDGFGGNKIIGVAWNIPEEAWAVWDNAFRSFVGINISPEALLATKVTTGTNYMFLAEITSMDNEYDKKAVVVTINDLVNSVEIEDILTN